MSAPFSASVHSIFSPRVRVGVPFTFNVGTRAPLDGAAIALAAELLDLRGRTAALTRMDDRSGRSAVVAVTPARRSSGRSRARGTLLANRAVRALFDQLGRPQVGPEEYTLVDGTPPQPESVRQRRSGGCAGRPHGSGRPAIAAF